ncbi:MAG TPA: hypothetical protein VLA28_03185, partial [Afifellaceae bacterium]|nr:hypothetical protein [Afifellaceae bacterium]
AGPPGPQSLEYYLEAGAGFNAAETADQEIVSTYEANLIAAVAAIEANSSFDATVDAYKAIAAIIAAFQEAENQSEDE